MTALDEGLQQRQPTTGYCSQVLLTPTPKFIIPRFYSTLRKKCAKKVDKNCKNWIEKQTPGAFQADGTKKSNVFLVDFVDLEDAAIPKIIIDLNMKLLEKN